MEDSGLVFCRRDLYLKMPQIEPIKRRKARHIWTRRILSLMLVLLAGPILLLILGTPNLDTHWRPSERQITGPAPHPAKEPAALVQVYGARAYNWRGAFGIHTWVATKRSGAAYYLIYQVVGWNLYRGKPTVTVGPVEAPDFPWYDAPAVLLQEHRGPLAEALIDRIQEAVAAYPYYHEYRVWPGPNSNTFTAFIAREVPELGVDLPPTAIGKDYLTAGRMVDRMPSGSGWQLSLMGLLGVGVAWEEGIELNVLGLSAGFDINDLALRLPGLGRVRTIM